VADDARTSAAGFNQLPFHPSRVWVVTFKRPCWQTLNIYEVNRRSQLTADLSVALNLWLIKADYIWPETRQHPVVQTPPSDLLMNIQHLLTGTLKSISASLRTLD
jgi:hypothetical protein